MRNDTTLRCIVSNHRRMSTQAREGVCPLFANLNCLHLPRGRQPKLWGLIPAGAAKRATRCHKREDLFLESHAAQETALSL